MFSTRFCALVASLLLAGSVACRKPPPKPPKPAKVPVTVEKVTAGPFRPAVDLLGRVVPSSIAEVRTPAAGVLVYGPSFADGLRTGAAVSRGQTLFRVESPEHDLRVSEARLAAKASETELERARKGVEAGILPAAELEARQIDAGLAAERLAGAERERRRLNVQAPVSGVLRVEATLAGGVEVTAGTVLGEIAGEGPLRVEAWVPARELDRLEVGIPAECRRPRGRTPLGTGTLTEISQQVEAGGAARAVIEISDAQKMPRPGEGVEVRVLLQETQESVTVPRRAVTFSGQIASVFVLEKVGKSLRATARPVITGGNDGDRIEILDGLEPGETVAVEGSEYLADGLLAEDVNKDEKGKGR